MESVCKILENFYSVIYPLRFRRYSDQDSIFICVKYRKSPIDNQNEK